jgi:leucine dehydrogenase
MPVLSLMTEMKHEQVVFCSQPEVGLRAIVAIHDTTLGPSLGGCRLLPYASEEEALIDVLRLSRGMTYKAAVTGLDLGGGKAVIIADPKQKTEAMFRTFGRFINRLAGRYITAEDMNTCEADMNNVRRETEYVTGVGKHYGGSGDPSPVTAWGVFNGIRGALKAEFGDADPRGRTVAIQGVGSVGFTLAKYLHEAGAKLIFSDISKENIKRGMQAFGGEVAEGMSFFTAEADVLAPCAIGAILNPETISLLRAPIVAGAANNQLHVESRDAVLLAERGIRFAPDYVINAGGLISVQADRLGFDREQAMKDAAGIHDTVLSIFATAEKSNITPSEAAHQIAIERIQRVAELQRVY